MRTLLEAGKGEGGEGEEEHGARCGGEVRGGVKRGVNPGAPSFAPLAAQPALSPPFLPLTFPSSRFLKSATSRSGQCRIDTHPRHKCHHLASSIRQ